MVVYCLVYWAEKEVFVWVRNIPFLERAVENLVSEQNRRGIRVKEVETEARTAILRGWSFSLLGMK